MNNKTLTEQEYIFISLKRAFDELLKNDFTLLLFNVNERTLTHRLAIYLEKYFPDYNVDCEYNRDGLGEDSKKLHSIQDQIPELLHAQVTADDENAVTVYPDIIIHRRGIPEGFIVIEAKKKGNNIEVDLRKLQAYKEQLGYKYAFEIIFPTGRENLSNKINYKEIILPV